MTAEQTSFADKKLRDMVEYMNPTRGLFHKQTEETTRVALMLRVFIK